MLDLDAVEWWTFDLVREALVEAVALWRRSPGSGRRPFATDGPWHLMLRELSAGDYDARGGFDTSSEVTIRRLPLSRAEVAQRDRISEWLAHVPKPEDARLLVTVCSFYASGYQQVPWKKVRRIMSISRGEYGLRKRFERAVAAISVTLNGLQPLALGAKVGDKK